MKHRSLTIQCVLLTWAALTPTVVFGQTGPKAAKKPLVPHVDSAAVDRTIKGPLSAQDQLKHFQFPKDFTVELVVGEPLVINPVTMTVDERGRIYVSESHTYRYGPSGSPIKPFANPVVRLDPLPDGKGYQRVLVADGFDDPVMGIAVKGDKLWLTANNYLYVYDLTDKGQAVNKKTILVDKNKAWNPFGMFVLEWGPDGLLYLSVGDHRIDIQGPGGKISGKGHTGIILRMNPDGTKLERLVQGLRVPYSFDYDPFGQLWLLSNGEGNPNRFVRVIDGVDYQCYTRPGIDNNWLAGNHPLAPPVFELPRGANTQLIRYYGAAFPTAYQGNLLLDNWGAHGFAGVNRAIHRYVPDERGRITLKETLLACTDPHFRPSHVALDPDGNLLVADWYGRDDESDKTGRIWRLKYVGKDAPAVKHKLKLYGDWQDAEAVEALGSPHHLIREKATEQLLRVGAKAIPLLRDHAAKSVEALGAANALWALARLNTPEAKVALAAGAKHSDWRVRRLAVELLRRYQAPNATEVAGQLAKDADPAVRVAAALALDKAEGVRAALLDALAHGAAQDEHLRYEAAWHLAKHGDADALGTLVASTDGDVRLAGLLAIDIACYENFPSKSAALVVLGKTLAEPGKNDIDHLLTLARLDGDVSLRPALEKLVVRPELPGALVARALMVLRAKGGPSKELEAKFRKELVAAAEGGAIKLSSPEDYLATFEFLESAGPSPFALKLLGSQLNSNNAAVKEAAHGLVRRFGTHSAPLAEQLWKVVLNPKAKQDDAVESLSSLARVESKPRQESWQKLLTGTDPVLRTEALRWWRVFKGKTEMVELLLRLAPELVKADATVKDDLAAVLGQLEVPPARVEGLGLPKPAADKDALGRETLAALAAVPAKERGARSVQGRQVFDRANCTRCHTTATQTTPLAPSLKGVAAQKAEYLVESVLYPSKVIKTGFESETVTTTDGKVYNGLVKDEGKFLRVLNLDKDDRIAKTDVERRTVQRVSIMPEGQEAQLSRREFLDLVLYLNTLK